jgi:hypothetical protein
MHQFPPGFTRKIAIGVGFAAVCAVLFFAMGYGGRPTAQEEANRATKELEKLYNSRRR